MTHPNDTSLSLSPDAHLGAAPRRAPQLSVVDPLGGPDAVMLRPNEAAGYLMLGSDQWAQLKEQCTMLVEDGALHPSISKPGRAMVIAMKAIEMGIPLTSAWTGMRFIDGEVCLLGKLALRLIQQRAVSRGGICKPIAVAEGEDWERAGWLMGRPGEEPTEYWFSMADAERAGLLTYRTRDGEVRKTSAYEKYGNRMLRWRALATGAAYEFADILQGCLLVEEMEHKDPGFIAAEARGGSRQKAQRPSSTQKPSFHTGAEGRPRYELTREHPEVDRIVRLVHQFAVLYSRLHSAGDTDREACYKEARRKKWDDISERCIRGKAPTQDEARCCQQILTDDIRRLNDAIRSAELEAAHAAQKAEDADAREEQAAPAHPAGPSGGPA